MKLLDERNDDFVWQLDEMLKRQTPNREPDVERAEVLADPGVRRVQDVIERLPHLEDHVRPGAVLEEPLGVSVPDIRSRALRRMRRTTRAPG